METSADDGVTLKAKKAEKGPSEVDQRLLSAQKHSMRKDFGAQYRDFLL